MPYMQTTKEFWDEIADGTFAKVLHKKDLCEQEVEPAEGAQKSKVCQCRERYREALPGRYAKAVANDILFADVPEEAIEELAGDDGPTMPDETAPKCETDSERKKREKAEAHK